MKAMTMSMNRFYILFLILALLMFAMPTMADSVDTYGLSETQKAELQLQAAKMKEGSTASAAGVSETIRNEAEQWGALGANMGRALVGAAKEVGVAANEFAATPLGKVTVGVVAYKIIGKDILGVLVGCFVLTVFYVIAIYYLFWGKIGYSFEYETKPTLFGFINRNYLKSKTVDDLDATGFNYLIAGVAFVLGTLIGLLCIF